MGTLSIVVPTFNRRERLARVLEGLEGQAVPPGTFEVVVIDDGSSDQTAEWLEGRTFAVPLRVIRQANQGPAAARNAGVKAASNPIVLFLDDDVVPGSELVREHLAMHEAERDLVVLGPLSSLPRYKQPWVAWEQAKLERQYEDMVRGRYEPTFRQFWTGNASVAREHVLAAGGFDTTLLRGEDVELGVRLAARGLKFRFNPRAAGLHHAERSLSSWCHAHSSYGKLEVQVFRSMSEAELLKVLTENFESLHPVSRFMVRGCVGRPRLLAGASAALKGWLKLGELVPDPRFSKPACSILANLLYWSASAEALDPTMRRRVFQSEGAASPAPTGR